jgi:hypothetical protein
MVIPGDERREIGESSLRTVRANMAICFSIVVVEALDVLKSMLQL